jgi:hypothetical protein
MATDYDYPRTNRFAGELAGKVAVSQQLTMPTFQQQIGYDLERARAEVARLEELGRLVNENPSTARILELMGRR